MFIFQCEDYEMSISPSRAWFGGDLASIVGKCECTDGFVWDDDDLTCETVSSTGLIIGLVISVIVLVGFIGIGICVCRRL